MAAGSGKLLDASNEVFDLTEWLKILQTAQAALGIKVSSGAPTITPAGNGEVQGATSATIMPTLACKLLRITALGTNSGNVYIGGPGVTKPDGVTDTTTGEELSPGTSDWFFVAANFDELYRICDNAGDDVTYKAYS